VQVSREWASEQFLNGTSAHRRPFQCHSMVLSKSNIVILYVCQYVCSLITQEQLQPTIAFQFTGSLQGKLRHKKFQGGGVKQKTVTFAFLGPYRLSTCSLADGQHGYMWWPAARPCGLQLACRHLTDQQWPEQGMGMDTWRVGAKNHW